MLDSAFEFNFEFKGDIEFCFEFKLRILVLRLNLNFIARIRGARLDRALAPASLAYGSQ